MSSSSKVDPQTGKLTSPSKRITNRLFNGGAAWSPDGESIAYYSWQNDERHIVIRSAKTGEERDFLPKLTPLSHQPVWFPDGRSLLPRRGRESDQDHAWRLRVSHKCEP